MSFESLKHPCSLLLLQGLLLGVPTAGDNSNDKFNPDNGSRFNPDNGSRFIDDSIWKQYQTFSSSCFFTPQHNFTVWSNLRENWKEIDNSNVPGVTFGLSCMSLLSRDFYRNSFLNVKVPEFRPQSEPVFFSPRVQTPSFVPDFFDWRDEGFVNPVVSQGRCGSCWAFAATGALEGAIKRKFGNLPSLSEQNLIDCAPKASGCDGGWVTAAYDYVMSRGGVDTDFNYGYEGDDNSCRFRNNVKVNFEVTGFQYTADGDEIDLLHALILFGPLAGAIDASGIQNYKSGVLRCSTSRKPNHGILIVGYGVDSFGQKYWIVKNSWGVSWGESGYIRIAREAGNSCGIASYANFPILR